MAKTSKITSYYYYYYYYYLYPSSENHRGWNEVKTRSGEWLHHYMSGLLTTAIKNSRRISAEKTALNHWVKKWVMMLLLFITPRGRQHSLYTQYGIQKYKQNRSTESEWVPYQSFDWTVWQLRRQTRHKFYLTE